MTTRELNQFFELFNQLPSDFAKKYRHNSNDQFSDITFQSSAEVISDVNFQGLSGSGRWAFHSLNIDGNAILTDCYNVDIKAIMPSTVDSCIQYNGNVKYDLRTTGDGNAHYLIQSGEALITGNIDHFASPSNYSVRAGMNGPANVTVATALAGQALLFDLRAEEGSFIYYNSFAIDTGATIDPGSQGVIMDRTGFLIGPPLISLSNADGKLINHLVTAGDETAQVVTLTGAVDKGLSTNINIIVYKKSGGVSAIGVDGLTSVVAGASDIVITFDLLNILEGDIVLAFEGLTV